MKILVTGFDPFGGESMNPSWEAVKKLPDTILGATIIKMEIPTVFYKSAEVLKERIQKEQPDVVLAIGQAGGRFEISIERVAINIIDARIPDNEKKQPIDVKIQEQGENAYFSNLPVKAMMKKVQESAIPVVVSNTAGTFVCNYIMYEILHYIHQEKKNIRGGFIHVPYIYEQVQGKKGSFAMNLNDVARAIELALEAVIENKSDIVFGAGEIQ